MRCVRNIKRRFGNVRYTSGGINQLRVMVSCQYLEFPKSRNIMSISKVHRRPTGDFKSVGLNGKGQVIMTTWPVRSDPTNEPLSKFQILL